jgi:hypothetical protein
LLISFQLWAETLGAGWKKEGRAGMLRGHSVYILVIASLLASHAEVGATPRDERRAAFVLEGRHLGLGRVEEQLLLTTDQRGRVEVSLYIQGVDHDRALSFEGRGRWQGRVLHAELGSLGMAGGVQGRTTASYQFQVNGDRCRSRMSDDEGPLCQAQGRRVDLEQLNLSEEEAPSAPRGQTSRSQAATRRDPVVRSQPAASNGRDDGWGQADGASYDDYGAASRNDVALETGGTGVDPALSDIGHRDLLGFRAERDGQTVADLAYRFGVEPQLLGRINDRSPDDEVVPGEVLVVPARAQGGDYPLEPVLTDRSQTEGQDEALDLAWREDLLQFEYGLHPTAELRVNRFLSEQSEILREETRADLQRSDVMGRHQLWLFPLQGATHDELLSVAVVADLSREGSAQRRYRVRGATFDPRSGDRIEPRDLFRAGPRVMDQVAALVGPRLRARDHDGSPLRSPTGDDIATVIVRRSGLEFVFDSDQLGWSTGWTSAYVSFQALDGLLAEDVLGAAIRGSEPE